MTFTYDLTTDTGKVRLLIPDTDSTSYYLKDAEIGHFLASEGSVSGAAVACCRWLARKFALTPNFSADGLRIDGTDRARVFSERADELERQMTGGIGSLSLKRIDGYSNAADGGEY